jgi:class 3 adenylate cyclase/predicted metal-dependent HD superfamily phosphohydrolase
MIERFINILIIDSNIRNQKGLKEILLGNGNNILIANSVEEGVAIVKSKEVGILILNIDDPITSGFEELERLKNESLSKTMYKLVSTENASKGTKFVRGFIEGAVDFITIPFNPILIRSKLDIFKALYHKDQRINQLLTNIFPVNVLENLHLHNKYTPKRVEQGVVLFTDFVNFSSRAKRTKPLKLVKTLEYYFNAFDEITERYKLEKIKTIGDAYMALAGVTENEPEPAIRACLAAIEIRDFMRNERDVNNAFSSECWEIRIGLHMGPLVAGIIGSSKMSFDIWGDTVNIAARTEAASAPGTILITKTIASEIDQLFEIESKGMMDIHKRGGRIATYSLNKLKNDSSLYGNGRVANSAIRKKCGLSTIDFQRMREDILMRMRALMPDTIVYHDVRHTLNVEKSAIRYAQLEGINHHDLQLLQTAALYHDSGYLFEYQTNEEYAVQLAQKQLPKFGYSADEIHVVTKIIRATESSEPQTVLEKIMCDADHDYLGRPDYYTIATKLREELKNQGRTFTEYDWLNFQLNYLSNVHRYHTDTAKNIRLSGKQLRIAELRNSLQTLLES